MQVSYALFEHFFRHETYPLIVIWDASSVHWDYFSCAFGRVRSIQKSKRTNLIAFDFDREEFY